MVPCRRLVLVLLLLALPVTQVASPVMAKSRSRTVTRAFTNAAPIAIPGANIVEPVSAEPYPATITVSGLKRATIRDVNLTLTRFKHAYPDQVEVLLVGPGGQTAVVMANVGGNDGVEEVTLRLDDEAAAPLPDATDLSSGSFQPTNAEGSAIAFNAPAPSASASAALSVFDGTNPNGEWRLFIQDEEAIAEPGTVAGGWALEIEAKVKSKKKR
jgi:subtilisin-like proprotein convertase family protein